MNPSDLPVRPEAGGENKPFDFSPHEWRPHDPDAGNLEPGPHHPGGRGGAAAVRSPEDPASDALRGIGAERVQEGPQGGRGSLAPDGPDGGEAQVRMTFVQHLDELRTRLLR